MMLKKRIDYRQSVTPPIIKTISKIELLIEKTLFLLRFRNLTILHNVVEYDKF